MYRVAIVEDEEAAAKSLSLYLERFGQEVGEGFQIVSYPDPVALLDKYPGFDLIFMDIRLPHMDGMKGAIKLRERDRCAKLIFVTSMAQYAARGYEVDAMDFMVKPVHYSDFCFKMKRVMNALHMDRSKDLFITHSGGMVRLRSEELLYVEVRGHKLTWHLMDRVIESRGSMDTAREILSSLTFLRPHNSYLVNPRHIDWVQGYELSVGGEVLSISHPRKKGFMEEMTSWYARGGR